MRKLLFVLTLICLSTNLFSQKIYGTVKNSNGAVLPFASISIKGTSLGVNANQQASYVYSLPVGKYVVVCQHIGYESAERTIDLKENTEINFVLTERKLLMKELVIGTGENPAYAIIRSAIKKREEFNNQVKSFECDLYAKDLIKLRSLPNKVMGQKVEKSDRKEMGLDSSGKGIVYLSESISTVYKSLPDKFKMLVKSSRVSGSNNFGFTFPAFINMYQNNVNVFDGAFNSRGFVSPIADGALRFYKYKMLGSFVENGKTINTIRVTPKRNYEPLFSGIINIVDDEWAIHSFDFSLTKKSQLEIIDTLQISQLHIPLDKGIWRVKNQVIYFNLKLFGIDVIGSFLSVYSDYKINPVFDKKLFDKTIIIYDSAVNKKQRNYWDSIRPIPLMEDEQYDYKFKDSMLVVKLDSEAIYNNIDTLKKRQGKIKLKSLFFPGINRTHYSKTNQYKWGIEPLLTNTQFNTVEGLSLILSGYYEKRFKKYKSKLTITPNFRYGFVNTHFNSWLDVNWRKYDAGLSDEIKNYNIGFSVGKKVEQYNSSNPIIPLVNTISTLFDGKNEMKIYEKYFASISYNQTFENGVIIKFSSFYEDRMPLENSTSYTFYKKNINRITSNSPLNKYFTNLDIKQQAFVANASISFKPGQRYIQFPKRKVPIGSDYPTFSIGYSKGINGVFGSDVDFDKWNFDIQDDKNFKLLGLLKYKLSMGGFLNNKVVFLQDLKHFNSNAVRASSNYVNGFQLMNSYINSNTAKLYYETHLEHHFNGLLTNKIPYFKKLNWNLVGGCNTYFINNNDRYEEVFVGLENIFKIFRLDFVTAFQNGKYQNASLVLGAGGLLGSGSSSSSNSESTSSGRSFSIGF
jgi:hypothetical protein